MWTRHVIDGEAWRVTRIDAAFRLDGRFYPSGSWLVQGPRDAYARALTQVEYEHWLARSLP